MKGLMTLVLAGALVLGVSNAYANESLVHQWVYGGEVTDLALIPTGLGLGIPAPILYSEHAFPGWRFSEETIAIDDGFALEKMVAEAFDLRVTDVASRVQEENGIDNIYREMGLLNYPDTVVLAGD